MDEEAVFAAVLEIEHSDERVAYLDSACAGDVSLRQKVEELLLAHHRAGGYLDKAAAAWQARLPTYKPPVGEALPGTVIGPYKLLELIGEGGMGSVYMAEQTEPVRRGVALKIIKPGMDSQQVIARFEAERQALALMDHPNIAKVLDAGAIGIEPDAQARDHAPTLARASGSIGRPYFVMELVRGLPITDYCDRARLAIPDRLRLFVQVCRAVQHAHQKGVIHRDLKPSNVLVTVIDGAPVPKVIDFGIAKATAGALTDRTLFTGFHQLVGTPLYMSPEQAELSGVDVDIRSDVYALGVLLYELLTGTTPFDGEAFRTAGLDEMRRIIREDEPDRPSRRVSTLAAELTSTIAERRKVDPRRLGPMMRHELDWVVMKALEKDRNRRYESAGEFAADVERYLHDEPVQACPPSAMYRFRKFARRNKVGLATASLLAASLMAVMAALAISNVRITQEQGRTKAAYEAEAEQRERAEANFRKARQAVDDYFTLISESTLLDLPGSQPLRKELLEAARRYHQAFLEQRVEDPQLQADLAVSYFRVSQNYHEIGGDEEAVRALESGLEATERLVREHPSTPELHQRLAGFYNGGQAFHLGGSLPSRPPEALRTLQKAASMWERFVREYPAETGFRSDLAGFYTHIGHSQRGLGQLADALVSYQKACALCEELVRENPAVPGYRAGLAGGHAAVGGLLRAVGRYQEAEKACRQALEVSEKLAADFPARPAYQLELGNGYHDLAFEFGNAGRYQEAEKAFRRALAIFSKLVGDSPTVPAYRERVGVTQFNLGDLLTLTDRREAETACRQALAVFERLATDFPTMPSYRERLVSYYHHLSLLLRDTGRTQEVAEAHRRAVALQEGLLADFPTLPRYQYRLAMLLVSGPAPQLPEARRAIALAQKAVAETPDNGNYWTALGAAHYRAGDWKAAVAALEKSREFRLRSRQNWCFLAMAHWQLGDKEQARRWYDQAVAWMQKNRPHNDEFDRLRAEAATLLGLPIPPMPDGSAVPKKQVGSGQESAGKNRTGIGKRARLIRRVAGKRLPVAEVARLRA